MTLYMIHRTCQRVGHNGQGISSQVETAFLSFMIVPTRHGYRLAFIRRKTAVTRAGRSEIGVQSPLLSARLTVTWRSIYLFTFRPKRHQLPNDLD
jgi:hypothetical protein